MIHISAEPSLPQMAPPPLHHHLLLLFLSTAAWIAGLAAAIGVWRTRVVQSKFNKYQSLVNMSTACSTGTSFDSTIIQKGTSVVLTVPSQSPAELVDEYLVKQPVMTCCVDEGASLGSPRSKFMMTYSCDCGESDEIHDVVDAVREVTTTHYWSDWEGIEVSRRWKGDLGWYQCQDRTVIDGNIVRLWGSDRGRVGGSPKGLRMRM